MRKYPSLLLAACAIQVMVTAISPGLQAQTVHRFTGGLYLQTPSNYGREAVYTDVLLWNYYKGAMLQPKSGQPLGDAAGEEQSVWTPVTVDTSGFFRPQPGAGGNLNNPNNPAGPGRIDRQASGTNQPATQRRWGPSYLYLTYRAAKAQQATLNIRGNSADEVSLRKPGSVAFIYLQKADDAWRVVDRPVLAEKGPHRNGTFKEAFNRHMVYVYGTKGTGAENKWAIEKATYDAESWYYRGNGAFDIIADHEFDPAAYTDRNIILVGNTKTNSAWHTLLADCPISVDASGVQIGSKRYQGDDLGGYFVWKKPGSDIHTVGVITGTGLKGMQAATANQYFAGASGFPDYMFFKLDMLKNGPEDIVDAGFYTNQWAISLPMAKLTAKHSKTTTK